MLLARAGYRVLMVDGARFPRDKLSTLYVHQPGVAFLKRWGVLDAVLATGCPPIERVVYQMDDVRLEGCSWPVDGVRAALAPRRYLLDSILAASAVKAGAEFRDGCTVTDLLYEGDRVVGVTFRTQEDGSVEERARLVVGADGMNSRVAALAGAPVAIEHPILTCAYYTYWSNVAVAPAQFEVHGVAGRLVGAVPTNDGLTLVTTYFPQAEFARVRTAAQHNYLTTVRAVAPDLYQRISEGTQVDRLYGCGTQRNFFRVAAGSGWALVGDAGHHKDSITALGMTDAFRQAQLLVDTVSDGLHDEPRLREALRRYATRRDEILMEGYESTLAMARLHPKRQLRMLQAITVDSALVECFFATLAGACPSTELLSRIRKVRQIKVAT
jgi:2-polyprenyl-6-methoxyphenol hydroxylase-like FAD-dependent oxidoreductase